jgi:transposase
MLVQNLAQMMIGKEFKFLSNKTYKTGYLWELEKVCRGGEVCPKCATLCSRKAGKCSVIVRDEGLRGGHLWLKIHKHRYYCLTCRKPFTQSVSIVWPRRRTTQQFRKALAQACEDMTDLARVRRKFRVSSGLMYKVFYTQIKTKLRERDSGYRWPKRLGIDEHFFKRQRWGSEFVSVFTDLKKRRLFEVARGKDVKRLLEQLKSIPGAEDVEIVAIDMSKTYRSLVRQLFPNAKIVADKFHVLRLLTPTIMKLGREIHGHRQELKKRKLLLRSRKKLDYDLRSDIDRYLASHPNLNEVYRWKERLFEVYRVKGFKRAAKAFLTMVHRMQESTLEPIQKLARTLKSWQNEVLLYFDTGLTNAFTEQTNNRGKLVQKRAYGYKSFENYRP